MLQLTERHGRTFDRSKCILAARRVGFWSNIPAACDALLGYGAGGRKTDLLSLGCQGGHLGWVQDLRVFELHNPVTQTTTLQLQALQEF